MRRAALFLALLLLPVLAEGQAPTPLSPWNLQLGLVSAILGVIAILIVVWGARVCRLLSEILKEVRKRVPAIALALLLASPVAAQPDQRRWKVEQAIPNPQACWVTGCRPLDHTAGDPYAGERDRCAGTGDVALFQQRWGQRSQASCAWVVGEWSVSNPRRVIQELIGDPAYQPLCVEVLDVIATCGQGVVASTARALQLPPLPPAPPEGGPSCVDAPLYPHKPRNACRYFPRLALGGSRCWEWPAWTPADGPRCCEGIQCPPEPGFCGDGACQSGEDCLICTKDCGECEAPPPSGCAPDATSLCLAAGRFRVQVDWQDFQGGSGVGRTLPLTADTGAFWFFDPANVELVVKVLDARAVNEHFWVFYGSLTSVAFEIEVVDTLTGAVRRYINAAGTFASAGDTAAFKPSLESTGRVDTVLEVPR